MNEKFKELPEAKQQAILNAAMEVFSKNEYKHASTDLIAAKAGISKGLLFYYFHNKKELYLYLYTYVVDIMKEQVADQHFYRITDFFELLEYATAKKAKIIQKNPYLLEFAVRSFYSEREAVSEDLRLMNQALTEYALNEYFNNIDYSKFKENVRPDKLLMMIVWMADGYLRELQMLKKPLELSALEKEFHEWTQMFKKLAYKEVYLDECD